MEECKLEACEASYSKCKTMIADDALAREASEQVATNDAGEDTSLSVDETLKQRGNRYGKFEDHAELSQLLQQTIFMHKVQDYTPAMRESITMICHKLARIANGDPTYDDTWRDIAGYATLVVSILNGEEQ